MKETDVTEDFVKMVQQITDRCGCTLPEGLSGWQLIQVSVDESLISIAYMGSELKRRNQVKFHNLRVFGAARIGSLPNEQSQSIKAAHNTKALNLK